MRRERALWVVVPLVVMAGFALAQGIPAVVRNFTGPVTITGTLTTSGASTASAYTATATSGDGLTLSNAAVDIQWPAANATLRGNASGIQTAGSFTAAGEGQFGTDGLRSEGTGAMVINNHTADNATGFRFRRSVNLTAGNWGCVQDNSTTELACVTFDGLYVVQAGGAQAKKRGSVLLNGSGAGSATVGSGAFCNCSAAASSVTGCAVSGTTLNIAAGNDDTATYICEY